MIKGILSLSLPLALIMVVAVAQTLRCAEVVYEQTIESKASQILEPELLKSNLYTIEEAVAADGLYYHYIVNSVYGTYRVVSTLALRQLLHELQAIAVMKKVETQKTAEESVKQAGKNTIKAVSNLFNDPENTIEGAAAGFQSLFNRASQVVGKKKNTDAEDSKLEQLIGKSKSKGAIATKYGVSVYSMNPVLQQELDRLAWADYLGGVGVGLAQSVVPGVGGLMLTASGAARLLNEVINTTPASELWVQNKTKLVSMGIDSDTIELFLNNPSFSPAYQTVLVNALEKMNGVANRGLFIKIALQANTYDMARSITEMATMLSGYHQHVAPLQSLAPFGRVVHATTKAGVAVVTVPADHVLWSETVARAATWLPENNQDTPVSKRPQLWIFGDFSKKAEAELQNHGWELYANSQAKLLPELQSRK
jgi:hypothetical protein